MIRRHGRRSIVVTLFFRVSLLMAVIVIAIGVAAFFTAKGQIDDVYDAQLITGAAVLQALMEDEIRDVHPAGDRNLEVGDGQLLSNEDRKAFESYADWRMFRIWRNGRLVYGSDTGPRIRPPRSSVEGAFSDVRDAGQTWRIYSLPLVDDGVVVAVGERTHIRDILIDKILLDLAVPLLLLVPASLALIWLSLNDGLRALRALVAEIGRRNLRELEPVAADNWPSDVEPLITSINLLFARLESTFAHERRFIDHAAHQLRTPLAALRLQAQLIAREEDAGERALQAVQIQLGADRAGGLIDDLLTLARLDADTAALGAADLGVEIASVLADIAPVAAAHEVDLAVEGTAPQVNGDPTLVRLILANLVENAVAHAPRGSEVHVALSSKGDRSIVTVSDQGPGIPATERHRVFERFYQGSVERSLARGSGLGLSITEQAARLLGATVVLDDREDGQSGLSVRVVLPQA